VTLCAHTQHAPSDVLTGDDADDVAEVASAPGGS
jgi:hypothetical protein